MDSCKSGTTKHATIVATTAFYRRVEIDASHVSMNSVGLLMHEKKYSKYIFIGVSPTYFRPTWLSTASTMQKEPVMWHIAITAYIIFGV